VTATAGSGPTDAEVLGDGAAVVGAVVGVGAGWPGTDQPVAVRVTGRLAAEVIDEGTPDDSARHSRLRVAAVVPAGTTARNDDPMGTLTAAPPSTGTVADTTTVLPPAETVRRAPSRVPAGQPSAKYAVANDGYAAASPEKTAAPSASRSTRGLAAEAARELSGTIPATRTTAAAMGRRRVGTGVDDMAALDRVVRTNGLCPTVRSAR